MMLSLLLGIGFVFRQVWGLISDRIGGLTTVLIGSASQASHGTRKRRSWTISTRVPSPVAVRRQTTFIPFVHPRRCSKCSSIVCGFAS